MYRKNIIKAISVTLDPEVPRLKGTKGGAVNRLADNRVRSKAWQQQRRVMRGYRSVELEPASVAACTYLAKQWGFKSRNEAVNAAVLYLCVQTRRGLANLDLTV